MTLWNKRIAVAGSAVGMAILLAGPAQAQASDTRCVRAEGCVVETPGNASKVTLTDGALDTQARGVALLLAGAAALVFVGVRRGAKSY